MSRHHKLKLAARYWDAAASGKKMFEIRKDDRAFEVGDTLSLHKWSEDNQCYMGDVLHREIVYTSRYEQKEGWIVLGLVEGK